MDRENRKNYPWNNYLAILAEHQIKSSLYIWYIRHCEIFIRGNEDIRFKQRTKTTVYVYLSELINTGQFFPEATITVSYK